MSNTNDPFKTQVGGGHYKDLPIQPVEFCQRNKLGFCESSAIAYLCRHGRKNGKEDLEKAIHFIRLLIEMEYPETTVPEKVQVPQENEAVCVWRANGSVWGASCGGQHPERTKFYCPSCGRRICYA